MAELGDIQLDEQSGVPHQLTTSGWRPLSQQELAAKTAPAEERFTRGFLLGETEGTAGALGRLLDIATLGLGTGALGKQAAQAGLRRVVGRTSSERVTNAIRQGAQDRAFRQRQQLGGSVATDGDEHLLRQLGGDSHAENLNLARQNFRSVGAAEVNATRESVFDLFTAPADLTAAQVKAIPIAKNLGFQFLPGQVKGSKLFLEGIKSDPILRGAVEYELARNRELLQRHAARAIGLADDVVFDADAMGLAADIMGEGFEGIAGHIGQLRVSGALADDIAPFLSSNQKRAMQIKPKGNAVVQLEGDQVMEVRSRLMRQATDEFRQGRSVVADDINDVVSLIDAQIDQAISPAVKRQWQALRERWRIFRILEKPNVIDLSTGNVNFLSARRNLNKEFKGEFGRQSFGGTGQRRGRVSQATSDFMDMVRVSDAFKDAVGDSGTATRLLSVQNLTHPVETTKKLLARAAIQIEADRLNVEPVRATAKEAFNQGRAQ